MRKSRQDNSMKQQYQHFLFFQYVNFIVNDFDIENMSEIKSSNGFLQKKTEPDFSVNPLYKWCQMGKGIRGSKSLNIDFDGILNDALCPNVLHEHLWFQYNKTSKKFLRREKIKKNCHLILKNLSSHPLSSKNEFWYAILENVLSNLSRPCI